MCDSKERGGDLGWITPGIMVPEFDTVAFNFAPGKVAMCETEFGWHVMRVAEASHVPPEISATELQQRIEAGDAAGDQPVLQLIDIRDDEERKQAMIPDAPFRHLPYNDWQEWLEAAIENTLEPPISRDKEVVLMDHRGGRGERIMQFLSQNGYVKARFLTGGINAYAEEADPSVPTYLESDGGESLT
jgi:rhodanese-related sulfurtransferase